MLFFAVYTQSVYLSLNALYVQYICFRVHMYVLVLSIVLIKRVNVDG